MARRRERRDAPGNRCSAANCSRKIFGAPRKRRPRHNEAERIEARRSEVLALQALVAFAVIAAALLDPLEPAVAIVGLVLFVLIEAGFHTSLAC
jgi:hypothetical protein